MALPFLLIALAFAAPLALAYVLASRTPGTNPFTVAGIAALPMGVTFLLFALWLQSTVRAEPCVAGQACTDPTPFGLAALLVWGIVALLCGFGMGMVGHALGSKRHRK
ncbi:hypothetical protein [Alteraurantiacibacter aquimixticola]|uniref:Uncharacterized protein n=1 Tax=Alteraurantiacibacter aquimixticola TaxID=2489173 RepID=A0A4V4U8J3_9SPHN|nr:hypothetical protein [Alteraurantiacibacter aquimixticola]TIX50293.1 hypothetical protein E5222_08385 [Alteraurantiacibacter aquimixticola]